MLPVPVLDAVLGIGSKVIDRLWPDPLERDRAKLELAKMAQEGEFKELSLRYEALLAEARSQDPWTSRARPAFLYVAYIMILWAIPMGALTAIAPEHAQAVAQGMRDWWAGIPSEFWTTFAIGYSGYTLARSAWDKRPPRA